MKQKYHLFLLILAVSIAYSNSFNGAFQFDDYNVIVDNKTVHSWRTWYSNLTEGIRPLLKFTYTLNWTSGAGLFGFHLVNTSIHAANVIMLYFLSLKIISPVMDKERASRTALFASLLFALHPVQTEAVTYISGRSVSLMSMFYLASILLYLRGICCEKMRMRVILLYILSPIFFVMAALTKETALTLPLALLLIERTIQYEKRWFDFIKKQAVHWGLLIVLLLAFIAHPEQGRLLEYSFDIRGMGDNIMTQINGISYLLTQLIVLNGMNIDPDLPIITAWSTPLFIKTVFLIILLALAIITLRFRPLFGFGILWFFLHLIPTNSIVPRLDVANDRQLYLASFGIFLSITTEAGRFLRSTQKIGIQQRAISVVAILILIMLCSFTIARNHDYRSEIALWEDTAARSPVKARVYNNLGYAYFLNGRIDDAKRAYLKALEIQPDYKIAHNNLKLIKE